MNIEKWIEENSELVQSIEEPFIEYRAIEVEDLRELLKTHAIVPREPSERQIDAVFPSRVCLIDIYKTMIKAAEEE